MRTDIHDEMERLLLLWIRDKELAGDTVTESIVSEKALSIYKDLQREAASTEGETSSGTRRVDFKASHGFPLFLLVGWPAARHGWPDVNMAVLVCGEGEFSFS